jgi:hypothetical protein
VIRLLDELNMELMVPICEPTVTGQVENYLSANFGVLALVVVVVKV